MNGEKPDVIWNQISILALVKCLQVQTLKISDVTATLPFSCKHSNYFVLHTISQPQMKILSSDSVFAICFFYSVEAVMGQKGKSRWVTLIMNTFLSYHINGLQARGRAIKENRTESKCSICMSLCVCVCCQIDYGQHFFFK